MAETEPTSLIQPTLSTDANLQLMEDRVVVEKRQVTSGTARVHVTVAERDETVEALLKRQDVVVDRVAVGAFVTGTPVVRQDGDTIVIPIFEERLVVEKRIFLLEELHVRINETEQATSQIVRLRRENADIDIQQ